MTRPPHRLDVVFLPSAVRDLVDIPLKTAESILARIERYAEGAPPDIKKLKGRGEIRLRVGNYRVLFVRADDRVEIHRVLHRREVYR